MKIHLHVVRYNCWKYYSHSSLYKKSRMDNFLLYESSRSIIISLRPVIDIAFTFMLAIHLIMQSIMRTSIGKVYSWWDNFFLEDFLLQLFWQNFKKKFQEKSHMYKRESFFRHSNRRKQSSSQVPYQWCKFKISLIGLVI